MSRALQSARAALWEAHHTGVHQGWNRYWMALISDPAACQGAPLHVATLRESMPLTYGLFGSLRESNLLLVGRHDAAVRDATPVDRTIVCDESSPVSGVVVNVLLPAEPSSVFAVATVSIHLSSEDKEPTHVLLGALERPKGWPL